MPPYKAIIKAIWGHRYQTIIMTKERPQYKDIIKALWGPKYQTIIMDK
jgi:hypothetical protein